MRTDKAAPGRPAGPRKGNADDGGRTPRNPHLLSCGPDSCCIRSSGRLEKTPHKPAPAGRLHPVQPAPGCLNSLQPRATWQAFSWPQTRKSGGWPDKTSHPKRPLQSTTFRSPTRAHSTPTPNSSRQPVQSLQPLPPHAEPPDIGKACALPALPNSRRTKKLAALPRRCLRNTRILNAACAFRVVRRTDSVSTTFEEILR